MRTSVAIATFFCVWFITLFAVLPFFTRTQEESGDVVPGTPEGAPARVNMWKIFAVNTVVATLTFAAIYATVVSLEAGE
jgi:predicted secreted protein